jgi:hypothetical protein
MQQFDINKMTPYNRQLGLKQMKAQAANQEYAQNVQNTFSSLGNLASVGMMAGNPSPAPAAGIPLTNQAGFDSFMASRGPAPRPKLP